jgi:hypothetical protein
VLTALERLMTGLQQHPPPIDYPSRRAAGDNRALLAAAVNAGPHRHPNRLRRGVLAASTRLWVLAAQGPAHDLADLFNLVPAQRRDWRTLGVAGLRRPPTTRQGHVHVLPIVDPAVSKRPWCGDLAHSV